MADKYLNQSGLAKVWELIGNKINKKLEDLQNSLKSKISGTGSFINIDITQDAGKLINITIDDDEIISQINTSTTTQNDIKIAGGPLADDVSSEWPEDWVDESGNKIIPSGKSFEAILSKLFLKPKEGKVSWTNPSWNPTKNNPTVTLSKNTAEVGSNITLSNLTAGTVNPGSRTCALVFDSDCGYFKSDKTTWSNSTYVVSKNGSTTGTASLQCTWNGTELDNPVSGTTVLMIEEGPNTFTAKQSGIIATVDALPETTVYASTNTKELLINKIATINDTKPDDITWNSDDWYTSKTVTGTYKYFFGLINKTNSTGLLINETLIKDLDNNGWISSISNSGTSIISSLSIPANGNTYIVAVPDGYTISSVLALGENVVGAWKDEITGGPKMTLTYTLPNNSTKKYNIFYCENNGGSAANFTNLTIKPGN